MESRRQTIRCDYSNAATERRHYSAATPTPDPGATAQPANHRTGGFVPN